MMKVLIISHNPLCTYNAMGKTLASLFSRFSREELCQLYIYPSYPDMDLCSSYFRVTDKEVLHSIGHSASPGCEVDKSLIRCDQNAFADQKDEHLAARPLVRSRASFMAGQGSAKLHCRRAGSGKVPL